MLENGPKISDPTKNYDARFNLFDVTRKLT